MIKISAEKYECLRFGHLDFNNCSFKEVGDTHNISFDDMDTNLITTLGRALYNNNGDELTFLVDLHHKKNTIINREFKLIKILDEF